MLRRNIRLRKEYLYLKKVEEEKKQYAEKIKSIKESYAKHKKIKSELRDEENELRKKMDLFDQRTIDRNMDDEYFFCGIENPRVLITTSRNPSSQLDNFAKELKLLIPNSEKINRGCYFVKDILTFARKNNVTDVIIVHEYKGRPRNLIISHLPFGPTLFCTIREITMRHDFKDQVPRMPTCYPHLIFQNFHSALGKRIMNIFKFLFPPVKLKTHKKKIVSFHNQEQLPFEPNGNKANTEEKEKQKRNNNDDEDDEEKDNALDVTIKNDIFSNLQKYDNNRIVTFYNKNDIIYFRHYTWVTNEQNEIILNEVGPRFSLLVYKINKEALDSLNEDCEYVLRSFVNSKKKLLA